jgi:hypothetical protein
MFKQRKLMHRLSQNVWLSQVSLAETHSRMLHFITGSHFKAAACHHRTTIIALHHHQQHFQTMSRVNNAAAW